MTFENEQTAFNQGDHETALKIWLPLAEQGYAYAQANLGSMYEKGRGVAQDYAEAVTWYRKAAEQSYAAAQTNLGRMYKNGKGVSQDYVLAYMWLDLAAAERDLYAQDERVDAARLMTPDQISEAQRMASEWMAKHQQ